MINSDLSEPWAFGHNMTINVSYGDFFSSFPTHWHNFIEIIAPLSDPYSVQIGNETYALDENSIALIPPRTLHAITRSPGHPHLIIQFPNTVLQQFHDFVQYRRILYGSCIFQAQDPGFEENPLSILLKILEYSEKDLPFKELHMYELLLHFFIIVGNRNLCIKNQLSDRKTPRQKAEDQKFDSVTNYIYEHCTEKITLEKTAAFAGFSKYYFPGFSRNTIRCPSRNILHPCVLQRLRNCWKTPRFPYWRLLCGQVFPIFPPLTAHLKRLTTVLPPSSGKWRTFLWISKMGRGVLSANSAKP